MTRQSFVSPATRDRVKKLGEPIALAMGRLGLTPNALTLIGFGIVLVGALLAAGALWLAAGIVSFVGAVFDMFDGTLARATGRTSRLGAFMDSTFDRWGEAVVYIGIVIGCTRADYEVGAWLAAAAMAAAFLVSYARARAESLGFAPGKGLAAVGFAPREIRTVILTVGLVGAGIAGGAQPTILAGALAIIAVLATVTVVQRILYVRRQAIAEDGR